MSLELNKIAGAVLTAGVIAMGSGFVADLLVKPHPPEEPVYKVALKDDSGGGSAGGSGGEEEQAPDLATLLANASASDGEGASRACAACHSFNEGGPNKVGPNLYNVMGADIAGVGDFNYSNALSSMEGEWTYQKMDEWLENPSGFAQGTSMSYNGIKDPAKRADVILYLREQSNNPPPLPEPEQQTAEASGSGDTASGDMASSDNESADTGSGDSASADSGASETADSGSGDAASSEDTAGESGSGDSQTAEAGDTQTAKAEGGESSGGENAGGGSELEQKVAAADPEAGKNAVAVCNACHSWNKGGPNKVGPNLWNVMHNNIASHDGFNYSNALSSMEGKWTLEKMDEWLEKPNEFAPGNRMGYPGVRDAEKRYNIIAYMLQQSDKAGGN